MKVQSVNQDLAETIKKLRALLKRDFGCDYSFSVVGRGHYISCSNIETSVDPIVSPPTHENILMWKCSVCGFQDESADKVIAHSKHLHEYPYEDAALSIRPVYRNAVVVI